MNSYPYIYTITDRRIESLCVVYCTLDITFQKVDEGATHVVDFTFSGAVGIREASTKLGMRA